MSTNSGMAGRTAANIDDAEVRRFAAMARDWWDPNGKFAPLHKLAPVRIGFVRDMLTGHFGLTGGGLRPLSGLAVLDVGCGGGLISEPLARLGAVVTGIEPAEDNISAARTHAAAQGLAIDYRALSAEDLAASGARYDAVVCLEVVEHLPDVASFIGTLHALVRPGGIVVLSTINRTLRSFALAIVGAEYVLRWLPVGTHDWHRFVTPEELLSHVLRAGFVRKDVRGVVYDPLRDTWFLSSDTGVNYMAAAVRP
jgi:2-polyprenyl-6-hydroxyphenyl methylase/3-demethylubiquinone-9 3-methyltransferase